MPAWQVGHSCNGLAGTLSGLLMLLLLLLLLLGRLHA